MITEAPQITIPTEWRWKESILIIEISLCALLPTKKLFGVHILNPNYQNDSFPYKTPTKTIFIL